MVPDYTLDSDGVTLVNSSARDILLYSLQGVNANDVPALGQLFLNAAYLLINYEMNKFTLWQVNATDVEDIVAIPPANCTTAAATTTGSSTVSSKSSSHPPSSQSPDHTLTTGSIAGAAIGGVTFVLLLVFAWVCIQKAARRRQKKRDQSFNVLSAHRTGDVHSYKYHHKSMAEVQEVAGDYCGFEVGDDRPLEMGYDYVHEMGG